MNALFYFLRAILCSEHTIPLKAIFSITDFAIVAKDSPFWLSIVASQRLICDVRRTWGTLWRHIRPLFLHARIDAKATSIVNKYSLLMHCIKIKSHAKSLLIKQYVLVGGNIYFLCVLSCSSEEA